MLFCSTSRAMAVAWLADGIGLDLKLNCSLASTRREDQIGGAVAGPHRSFDRRRQSRVGPVAGKEQILKGSYGAGPQCVLLGRRLECGAALAYDLPGRQVTADG